MMFSGLQAPRAPLSVQRFCDAGYLDCVTVRGGRCDRYFVSRASVKKYAEELRPISSIGVEARNNALERDEARQGAPLHSNAAPQHASELDPDNKRLADESINLRMDNRDKEQAINMLMAERREAQTQLQHMSYRLGTAESRFAQLDAPKKAEDLMRDDALDRGAGLVGVIVEPVMPDRSLDATEWTKVVRCSVDEAKMTRFD